MYYVKAFYPGKSFKQGYTVGCILYSDTDQHKADRVRDELRRMGVASALVFTHDEQGRGTTSLESYSLSDLPLSEGERR